MSKMSAHAHIHPTLTRDAEMNELIWSAERSDSFLEGVPLSSGRQMVPWPGGCKPSFLTRGFGPVLCLSLHLSSRAGRRRSHASLSLSLSPWSLHKELEGGARVTGAPATRVPTLCAFNPGGWWQGPVPLDHFGCGNCKLEFWGIALEIDLSVAIPFPL